MWWLVHCCRLCLWRIEMLRLFEEVDWVERVHGGDGVLVTISLERLVDIVWRDGRRWRRLELELCQSRDRSKGCFIVEISGVSC